jgi:asparagine synthase (glutamine-hydrolysing)
MVTPITFGMAGVIYTGSSGDHVRDESWMERAFQMTRWTTRCRWRSDDMTVITQQHAHDVRSQPGTYDLSIPESGSIEAVVFGQFFAVPAQAAHLGDVSRNLLSAYLDHGASGFRKLNGLWAAAVWDRHAQQAFFARDSIGGQTLYAMRLDRRIVFATDLRAFQAAGLTCTLDEEAIAQFLHYLYVPAPRSLLEDCVAVLPGSVLSVGEAIRQEKYSAPRFVSGTSIGNQQRIVEEIERQLPRFEEKLLASVADCIPPQGRIALALSGGKDSSVLAIALSKLCPDRVLAFTVGQSDARLNESDDAALVCAALGLAHHTYVPSTEDLARGILEFARVQDQPVGDLAALPYFLGMSQLPEDCTVVIDGTGNDYYFGIPGTAKGLWRYERRRAIQEMTGPLWPVLLRLMARGPEGARRLSHFWQRPVEESFVAWEGWSTDELAQLFGRGVSLEDTHLWKLMRSDDPGNWLNLHTEVVCGVWEPHAAYRKAIHFAQALGRSIRFPFTDNRLATFVQGLPSELKFRDGVNKQLLRAYMMRGLPRAINEKPKSGFIFDINQLLLNPVFRWPEELDRAALLQVMPGWAKEPIAQLLKRHTAAPDDMRWQQRLYALCLLATVLAVKDGYDPPVGQHGVFDRPSAS